MPSVIPESQRPPKVNWGKVGAAGKFSKWLEAGLILTLALPFIAEQLDL